MAWTVIARLLSVYFYSFDKRLWQRNYYEHIIRDGESHARIAEYIRILPANWATDRNNPDVKLPDNSIDEIVEWLESFKQPEV